MEERIKKSKRIRYPKKSKKIKQSVEKEEEERKNHFVLEVHDSVMGVKSQL